MTVPEVGSRFGPSSHSLGLERNVFSTKSRRDERRQKVLDELPELDPAARRSRLDQAVAAGDVRSDEVESALRLVQRLEALSVFTIPPMGGRQEPTTPSVDLADRGPGGAAISGELLAIGPGAARAEAARRLVARDRATRKTGAVPHPPRRGRGRAAPGGVTAMPLVAAVPVQGEPAPEGSRGEHGPSISWLRP